MFSHSSTRVVTVLPSRLPGMKPEKRKGMIIGMGNSMLDLIGSVDMDVLQKYNLMSNHNYLAKDEHKPLFKELIEKYHAKYVVGGSAQNTLRVAQWVLVVPEVCVMMGAIGQDDQGKMLVDRAKADGVDTQYQYVDNKPTGVCGVLLTNNGTERTLLADLSASLCFTVEHLLKDDNQRRLHEADIIYVTGFFMSVSTYSIMHSAKIACELNKWFVMNLSASFLAETYKHEWTHTLPFVDIVFGNDIEAKDYAKALDFGETRNVEKIALTLSCLPKIRQSQERIVIITQGEKPVIVAKGGSVTCYPVIELSKEQVVDTTGAGDAFVGGFLAQLVQGKELERCVECALWCASQIVQQEGCSIDCLIKCAPK